MKQELATGLDPRSYRIEEAELLTPALLIYTDLVRHNVQQMITVLSGDAGRWRPHLKTVKLASMMKLLVEAGVTSAKCATTLELRVACESGFRDVLVAYPHTGANARRVAQLAHQFPEVRVSAIVEAAGQIESWAGTRVGLFIDINTGMNRTGIERDQCHSIEQLARQIQAAGLIFRGLHFYDGNSTEADLTERTQKAHARYGDLLNLISDISAKGVAVRELITSGTPALPCAISFELLWNGAFRHQVSPGTTVYNDASSLGQLPESYDFRPAVLVISRVVSHPTAAVVTCDAGHKSLSVDSGVPNCIVLGKPDLRPLKPSEEHLPIALPEGACNPSLGESLYLLPRHVCPTVNNFDSAVLVANGTVSQVVPVSARGRESPL